MSFQNNFSFLCRGSTDPYRLYNLDVFEYDINTPMSIYGAIPFMVAHRYVCHFILMHAKFHQ